MTAKQEAKLVGELVAGKFKDFQIDKQGQSPNGFHFLLTKDGMVNHLKVVNSTAVNEEGIDEIELLNAVSSEYIIELVEYGELNEDYSYLVFPHIDGSTLDELKTEKGWSEKELRKLALDMANAINAMDQAGIVHRDIKPKNIIKDNVTGNYILLDLGIGYFMDQADRDNSKAKGSRNYSSPEQFKSIESDLDGISPASDMFSLGVILYELATNQHPFSDYSSERYSTIGEAICKMKPHTIASMRTDLDVKLSSTITKLLEKSPSKRYWNPTALINSLNNVILDDIQTLKFYIAEPKSDDFLQGYLNTTADDRRPDGVLLPINSSKDRLTRMKAHGLNVILDPEVFKLLYPKASQSNIRKALKLGDAKITATKLNDDRFLRRLVEKVVTAQEHASVIILPYFAITTLDDGIVEINQKVENIYYKYVHSATETRKVYGGVMVSHALITNSKSRTRLLDKLMQNSRVDGYFTIFENSDDSPFVLQDDDYLDGVNEVIAMLKSQGEVIVARADIAFIPLLKSGTIITSPDKSMRRYSFKSKLTDPKKQEGSTGEESWALRYFSGPLFNFIEEKATLERLASAGFEKEIGCDCRYCNAVKPFDPSTDKSHNGSRMHFYYKIAGMRNQMNGLKESELRAKFIVHLTEAARIAEQIELKTIGGERFSRHERLIEIV